MSDRSTLRASTNLSCIDAYYIVEYLAKNHSKKMLLGFLPIKTDRPQAYRPGGATQPTLQAGSRPPAGGHRLTGQAHLKVFSGAGKQAACEATGAHL